MDQIYNSMLFMAQVPAERPAGKPAQSQESDSFQKQMEQASGKTEGKTETAVQDQPQEGPVTVEDSQELEKQMAAEVIDGYDSVSVRASEDDPTVCLVEFGFSVAHGLNQVYLTVHISI